MYECLAKDFEYFDDYFDEVVREAWLSIIAEDHRLMRAVNLMLFKSEDNDRSIEANLLASVAEEYNLEPEDIDKMVLYHQKQLVGKYE